MNELSRLYWRRVLSRGARPFDEVAIFPCLAPEAQRRVLAERLQRQVQYFGARADALPEWRAAARIRDPLELWRVFPSLPVVTRELLRTRFEPRALRARCGLAGQLGATGGSTGEPVRFLHDGPMLQADLALHAYTRLRLGWRPGMATVIVWGSDRDIRKNTAWKTRAANRLLRHHFVNCYDLSPRTAAEVLRAVRRHRPVAIYGFSAALEYVARQVLRAGDLPAPGDVRTAWNGGEMLFPSQSELFERAFGVPVRNRYGSRELPIMACQFAAGEPLQVLRPWLFVEVVDAAGRPVAPGESGRLLWTSTVCRGTPFLRYDIGDLGVPAQVDEAGIGALREIQGRLSGLLQLPSGKTLSCIYWNHLFKEYPEVHGFQVVLRKAGGIRLLLTGAGENPGLPPAREARLRATLGPFLEQLPVEIAWVPRIPPTAEGKHVQVVREA